MSGGRENKVTQEMLRQGDILLVRVDEDDHDARMCMKDDWQVHAEPGEGIIVAAGEVTGHHHRIRGRGVRMYRRNNSSYIRVGRTIQPRQMTHEEHQPVTLEQGTYKVVRQREYAPRSRPVYVRD